jgi:hypothetical protein
MQDYCMHRDCSGGKTVRNHTSRAKAQAVAVNAGVLALIAAVSITVAVLVGLSAERTNGLSWGRALSPGVTSVGRF